MSEQRIRFEGVTCSADHLRVFFTIGDRQAKRVRELKVPYSALLETDVVTYVDACARARLRALWDLQQQPQLPWN